VIRRDAVLGCCRQSWQKEIGQLYFRAFNAASGFCLYRMRAGGQGWYGLGPAGDGSRQALWRRAKMHQDRLAGIAPKPYPFRPAHTAHGLSCEKAICRLPNFPNRVDINARPDHRRVSTPKKNTRQRRAARPFVLCHCSRKTLTVARQRRPDRPARQTQSCARVWRFLRAMGLKHGLAKSCACARPRCPPKQRSINQVAEHRKPLGKSGNKMGGRPRQLPAPTFRNQ